MEDPSQDGKTVVTLSPIEAQRAIAVLAETVEKLNFLGSITPDVVQHRDELSKFVGDEIARIINEQKVLEATYEDLISERATLKGLANKQRYKAVQGEIADVSRALRESTKQLCHHLKDNPNISGNLIKIQRERVELIEVLQRSMGELHEGGTFTGLAAQVASNRAATNRMATVVDRERSMAAAVAGLDQALSGEKQAHASGVAAKKAEIAALKEQLQAIKSATTVEARYSRKAEGGKTSSLARGQGAAEKALEAEIRALRAKLETERVVHEESVAFLSRKHGALASEVERWGERHEVDLAALEHDLEGLKEKQMVNRERLDALEARKAKDDAAAAATKAEREARAAALEAEAAETARKGAAAVVVQKMARAYLKKKAEAAAASGKKKKGGKKGKKKK